MTNKEQIRKEITTACDFIEQIISDPSMLDKIPESSAISFLDAVISKPEKEIISVHRKYVKVKRQFEVL